MCSYPSQPTLLPFTCGVQLRKVQDQARVVAAIVQAAARKADTGSHRRQSHVTTLADGSVAPASVVATLDTAAVGEKGGGKGRRTVSHPLPLSPAGNTLGWEGGDTSPGASSGDSVTPGGLTVADNLIMRYELEVENLMSQNRLLMRQYTQLTQMRHQGHHDTRGGEEGADASAGGTTSDPKEGGTEGGTTSSRSGAAPAVVGREGGDDDPAAIETLRDELERMQHALQLALHKHRMLKPVQQSVFQHPLFVWLTPALALHRRGSLAAAVLSSGTSIVRGGSSLSDLQQQFSSDGVRQDWAGTEQPLRPTTADALRKFLMDFEKAVQELCVAEKVLTDIGAVPVLLPPSLPPPLEGEALDVEGRGTPKEERRGEAETKRGFCLHEGPS
jgi:hypothetical protein